MCDILEKAKPQGTENISYQQELRVGEGLGTEGPREAGMMELLYLDCGGDCMTDCMHLSKFCRTIHEKMLLYVNYAFVFKRGVGKSPQRLEVWNYQGNRGRHSGQSRGPPEVGWADGGSSLPGNVQPREEKADGWFLGS